MIAWEAISVIGKSRIQWWIRSPCSRQIGDRVNLIGIGVFRAMLAEGTTVLQMIEHNVLPTIPFFALVAEDVFTVKAFFANVILFGYDGKVAIFLSAHRAGADVISIIKR